MQFYSSHTVLPEQKLVVANFQGKIQITEIILLLKKLSADKTYSSSFNFLLDFNEAIAIAFTIDVMEVLEYVKKSIKLESRIQCGILSKTPNFKFLVSYAKTNSANMNVDIENFENIDECLTWMNFSPITKSNIKNELKMIKSKTPLITYN